MMSQESLYSSWRLTKGRHCLSLSYMEKYIYEFKPEKNIKLLEERGIGFEDVIAVLDAKGPLTVLDHPNVVKYPHQKIYVLGIDGYAYLVPFEKQGNKVVLKTIYPSRKLTKICKSKL